MSTVTTTATVTSILYKQLLLFFLQRRCEQMRRVPMLLGRLPNKRLAFVRRKRRIRTRRQQWILVVSIVGWFLLLRVVCFDSCWARWIWEIRRIYCFCLIISLMHAHSLGRLRLHECSFNRLLQCCWWLTRTWWRRSWHIIVVADSWITLCGFMLCHFQSRLLLL